MEFVRVCASVAFIFSLVTGFTERSWVHAAPPKSLEVSLRNAVSERAKKLGALEAWQKRVLEEEVLVEYRRFIKEFRQVGDSTQAGVDTEGLKKYLSFGASKFEAQADKNLRFGYYFTQGSACSKCREAEPEVRKFLLAALLRRGFQPVAITDIQLGGAPSGEASLKEKLNSWIQAQGLRGAVAVQAAIATDEVDAAHADQRHFQIQVWMWMTPKIEVPQTVNASLELMGNESLSEGAALLFANAVTDAGAKILSTPVDPNRGENDEEVLIVFKGIRGFEHYSLVKASLLEKFKDSMQIEERKGARGMLAFAIRSGTSDQVNQALKGWDDSELKVKWEVQ